MFGGKSMQIKVIKTGPLSVNTLIVPLCENKVFVVDPADCKYSEDEGKVASYISENELQVVAVILTHGHFDHVSGLPFLCEKNPNIPVLIHEKDARLLGSDSALEQNKELSLMGFREFLPFVSNLPSVTNFLQDGKTLLECFGGNQNFDVELKTALSNWEVIHTPGHTPGCVCVLNEKEKILISGDTIFYHSWGRTDFPGGSEIEIQKSLRAVYEKIQDDVRIYPGHDYFGFTKKD